MKTIGPTTSGELHYEFKLGRTKRETEKLYASILSYTGHKIKKQKTNKKQKNNETKQNNILCDMLIWYYKTV